MPGTQICGRHAELFGRTLLYLVLWANIASGLVFFFFSPMTYIFWTAYVNYLKFGIKTATTIKVKGKFEQSMF